MDPRKTIRIRAPATVLQPMGGTALSSESRIHGRGNTLMATADM